jgi:hypothetical protein
MPLFITPMALCLRGILKRGNGKGVAQMGWEQIGTIRYYYRKELDGVRVKSVYVGRGEMAHVISQFQASSTTLEPLTRANNSI